MLGVQTSCLILCVRSTLVSPFSPRCTILCCISSTSWLFGTLRFNQIFTADFTERVFLVYISTVTNVLLFTTFFVFVHNFIHQAPSQMLNVIYFLRSVPDVQFFVVSKAVLGCLVLRGLINLSSSLFKLFFPVFSSTLFTTSYIHVHPAPF